jgi:hypothetical protein
MGLRRAVSFKIPSELLASASRTLWASCPSPWISRILCISSNALSVIVSDRATKLTNANRR